MIYLLLPPFLNIELVVVKSQLFFGRVMLVSKFNLFIALYFLF